MRIARLNCECAIRGFDVSMLKTEQFHQWVSDFNAQSATFSSHVGDTGKRLPGLSVGPPCIVSCRRWDAFWCLLCFAAATHVTPAVCMTKHGLKYRPHFVPTICQCEPRRLLASLAESDYCWLLSHSVSAETRKPIYRICRYASAVNEYSPIYDIGLTLPKATEGYRGSLR